MLGDIKLLLGIKGEDQDEVLKLLINITTRQMLNKMKRLGGNSKFIPEALEHIIIELVIVRYNRIGSEGIEQETVEGYSATYSREDLSTYTDEIKDFIDEEKGIRPLNNVVRFI